MWDTDDTECTEDDPCRPCYPRPKHGVFFTSFGEKIIPMADTISANRPIYFFPIPITVSPNPLRSSCRLSIRPSSIPRLTAEPS